MYWIAPSEKDTAAGTLETRAKIQNLRRTRDPDNAGLPRLLSGQVNLKEN